ncbi:hypothetical protein [Kitasatospora sp. NPDC087314]|uniref:hypothetical protein n=1 Tax=Kitasatospora sp. NPDC087314 TaxID=3364068 RepID=UPI00382DD27B
MITARIAMTGRNIPSVGSVATGTNVLCIAISVPESVDLDAERGTEVDGSGAATVTDLGIVGIPCPDR